jgi:hypothetical protein
MEKNFKYLGYFFLILIPLTIGGFYKTYFGLIPDFNENITFWIHVHSAIASLWIIMLCIQPLLIQFKKVSYHKWLGKFSYVLFPLLILSFWPQAFAKIDHSKDLSIFSIDGIKPIFFPIIFSILLVTFYSLAMINRKNTGIHMRYMIATAIVFIDPTLNRILNNYSPFSVFIRDHITFGIQYLILFGLIYLDSLNKRNFNPYVVALICFIIYDILYCIVFY